MKILVVRTSALGDIVQTFPAVGYLKSRFPEATIDWIIEKPFSSLVKAHPDVSRVIEVDTKEWRRAPWASATWKAISQFRREIKGQLYDVAFDLQGNLKSGILLSQVSAKDKVGFARASVSEWPNLLFTRHKFNRPCESNIRSEYLSIIKQFYKDSSPYQEKGTFLLTSKEEDACVAEILSRPQLQHPFTVLVAAGSAWKNKELPLDQLIHFLKRLKASLGASLLFSYGSEEERLSAESLSRHLEGIVVPKLSLPALQKLMQGVGLVIGMDSLPLHLAGTTSTPAYGFFGPSLADKYSPPNSGTFQGRCPYNRVFTKRCPVLRTCPTGACLRDNSAEELFQQFTLWWMSR